MMEDIFSVAKEKISDNDPGEKILKAFLSINFSKM